MGADADPDKESMNIAVWKKENRRIQTLLAGKKGFDIRTDRFEVAIDAIDKINQSTANQIAKNKGETEAVKDFETGVKTDPEKS